MQNRLPRRCCVNVLESQELTQISPGLQKLLYKGILKDEKTLKDCGVKSGTKVMLMGNKAEVVAAANVIPKQVTRTASRCPSHPDSLALTQEAAPRVAPAGAGASAVPQPKASTEVATYIHSTGELESVTVVKRHSDAEGGGVTIMVPSLGRERMTLPERMLPPLAVPPAAGATGGVEVLHPPRDGVQCLCMGVDTVARAGGEGRNGLAQFVAALADTYDICIWGAEPAAVRSRR